MAATQTDKISKPTAVALAIGGIASLVAIPNLVRHIASLFEDEPEIVPIVLWASLLVVAVATIECFFRLSIAVQDGPSAFRTSDPRKFAAVQRSMKQTMRALQVAIISLMQAGIILQYTLVLDGHRLLKACIISYLIYAGPALFILAVRRKPLSVWEEISVKWGWVFMIAFGMPLILPSIPPLIPPEVLRI